MKGMIETNAIDQEFLEHHSSGFDSFLEAIQEINVQDYVQKCGVARGAIELLLNWLKEEKTVSHIVGCGLQKHSNNGQTIRAIESAAAIRGDITKLGGGVFLFQKDSLIFNNQGSRGLKNRNIPIHQIVPSNLQPPIEMLWVSCGNPLTQEPNSGFTERFMKDIPFIVTVAVSIFNPYRSTV